MPSKLDHKLIALLAVIIDRLRKSDDAEMQEFVKRYDKLLSDD